MADEGGRGNQAFEFAHGRRGVLGIDLTRPVSDSDRAAMNRAFVERSVLVIRDQALTPPQVVEAVGSS